MEKNDAIKRILAEMDKIHPNFDRDSIMAVKWMKSKEFLREFITSTIIQSDLQNPLSKSIAIDRICEQWNKSYQILTNYYEKEPNFSNGLSKDRILKLLQYAGSEFCKKIKTTIPQIV